jgi:ankyrin repeat protein
MKQFWLLLFIFFSALLQAQDKTVFDVARKGTMSEIKAVYDKDKSVVNAIDEKGSSMLILACYRGNHDVAKFLIENGADLNYVSVNGTALMACVFKSEFELVDELISKKTNVDLTDGNGMTALMYAVQFKNVEMVKKLVSAGANKALKCKQEKTAFEYAIFSNNEEIINVLK